MATPRRPDLSFSLLLSLTLGAACALVLTVIWSFSYQLVLKDQENLIRESYGEWNGLLSDAKSLATSGRPLGEVADRFRARLGSFREVIVLMRRLSDPRIDRFRKSLEFGVQYVADLGTWLDRLSTSSAFSALTFEELSRAEPNRPETRWIRSRLADLDDLFGTNLGRLKDLVNDLIVNDLKTASDRSVLVGYLVLAGMSALLAGLLLRIRRLNRHLNELVKQRTSHLEQAQEKLVASEKLAVLGSLAAGVAHELNTPLAALQSASGVIFQFMGGALSEISELYSLSPESRTVLNRILAAVLEKGAVVYTPSDRAKVRNLARRLRSLEAPEPENQAESWLEMGLAEVEDCWTSLCCEPEILLVLPQAKRIVQARRMAGLISQAVGKASNVVAALRNYLGNRSAAVTVFSLREEWQAVLLLLGMEQKTGLRLKLDIADVRVTGMREQLSQVWINLVNNALQAMGSRGTLVIRAEPWGEWVRVSVTDSGPGIPPEIATEIFTPFFSTKKDTGGLGLGLDICRKIVESNGGAISFESVPGKTVFTVDLPLAR